MNYNEMVEYILSESTYVINDAYYHAFQYNHNDFINMITEGIKSPILLGKSGCGSNGLFYVCLSKKHICKNSVYNILSSNFMFVINSKLKTIKARNFMYYNFYPIWFTNSPLPFRECEYDDEYQKFLKVLPKDFMAIQCNIFSNLERYNSDEYTKYELLILKQIISDLNSQKIYLPIIDASTSLEINQEKVLRLEI